MSTITVSGASALQSALAGAKSGDVIRLAAGNYGAVSISDIHIAGNVTITSATSSGPVTGPAGPQAILTGLSLVNSSGITFTGLQFAPAASSNPYPFRVTNSSSITFDSINFRGPEAASANNPTGLLVSGSNGVKVLNSELQHLANGLSFQNDTGVTVSNNNFHDLQSDGVDASGTSYLTVSGNRFTNFHPLAGDHPDAIQMWTVNTTASAHDIAITGNTITQGSGGPVQGIFLSDESGHLPYQNVTVTGNTVVGGLWNGIVLAGAANAVVANNTLTAGVNATWIGLSNVDGVDLSGNSAPQYQVSGVSGLVESKSNIMAGVVQPNIVYSSSSATLGPLAHTLVLTGYAPVSGTANDFGSVVQANNGGDRLYDGKGNDTLIGGAGTDVLYSRWGSDTLTGGAGSDIFQIGLGVSHTTITDFSHGDALNLAAFIQIGLHPVLQDHGTYTDVVFAGSSDVITLQGVTITLQGVTSHDLIPSLFGFTH